MARPRNSFAKRQRETGKKQKAEDKRARRLKRKEVGKVVEDCSEGDRAASEQEPGVPESAELGE